jgi:hypothetical protein
MNRKVRGLVQLAEAEGLKVTWVEIRSRHFFVHLLNAHGLRTRVPVSRGSKPEPVTRTLKNDRADLRRFARRTADCN